MNRASETKKSQSGSWFMYLFLSIFVVIGSGCLLYAPVKLVKTVLFISRAATTTGTVTDLHASRGSKSTTYAPVVSFSAPAGRSIQFRSQISSGSSDYSIGEQVPVYYDPRRPEIAEIRAFVPLWMPTIILSALGLAFTAVGGGTMIAMRRGAREAHQKEAALQQGMKDWETEPAWRAGTIRSSTRQEMWFYWLFAVGWNAIAQPTGFIVVHEFFNKGNRLAAVGLMFPLVGFWLLLVAIRKTLQVRKFGEIVLQMNPLPGSLGGEVGGVVELPVPFRAEQAFSVSLSCQKSTSHNNSTTQELVWQDAGRAVTAPTAVGTRIAFRFAVPAQLPPSGNSPECSHQWIVRVTADLPGIDLDRSFQIPVVASASPQASTLTVPLASSLEPVTQLPATIVCIEQSADHLTFRYPPRRNLKSGLVIVFMGGWFLFFTYLFIVKGAAGMGIVMLPVFGLIGLVLLLTAVWMFGYSLEVDAAAGELVVVRRFLGMSVKRVLIPASALQAVEAIRFGVLGSGSTATLIFNVVACCGDGSRITVGDGIEGRANAETIARMIAQKYGLGVAQADPFDDRVIPKPAHMVVESVPRVSPTVETPVGAEVTALDVPSAPAAMWDSKTMTCPQCGAQQPTGDICNVCQVIIAKYLQHQAMMSAAPQAHASKPSGLLFGKLLVVAVGCLVCWFVWQAAFATPKGDYKAESGLYRDEKFGFALAVPSDWKVLTVKEAIQCSTLRNDYADQYLFLASPTTPTECLLVANIAGISLDYFRSTGWDGYLAEIGGRHPVKFSDIRDINGLKVYRVGYEIAGFYREDAYFEAGKKLIELYFYVPNDTNASERSTQIRRLLEDNLRRL